MAAQLLTEEDKRAFFEALDTDNDGRISLEEFKRFIDKFYVAGGRPSDASVEEMFRAADKDGNHSITFDEIHAIMEA